MSIHGLLYLLILWGSVIGVQIRFWTRQIVSKAIEQLTQAVQGGHGETHRNYLATIGQFHQYSLRNIILIVSQKPI